MRNPRTSSAIFFLTTVGLVFLGLLLLFAMGVVWAAAPDVLTVTNTNDSGPGSLRQAMLEALPQDEIRFDPSLSEHTISLISGEIRLDRSVTIDASDAPTLTISAGANSRIFFVNGSGVTVRNLILADGKGTGTTYPPADGYGGCIYVTSSASFKLDDVEVRDCQAQFGGGAIANFYSTLYCTDCYLHDNGVLNEFGFGGAVYNYAGFDLASTVTISSSEVLSNVAASGGAFMNDGNGDPAHMTVRNSFVGQNQATASGGGFFNIARQQTQMSQVMGNRLPEPNLLPSANLSVADKIHFNSAAFVRDAELNLDRTFVAGNEAAVSCGGICNAGDFNAVNTMISANKAMTGGAIVNGDQLNIDWTTFAFNEADFGNAIAYSDVFGFGAKIAVNNSILWNPDGGPAALKAEDGEADDCLAKEPGGGDGITDIEGGGNIISDADCGGGEIEGQVKDPKFVEINNNVYILDEGNEVSDASSKERPDAQDIVGVPSEPPQAPGAQGHEHILTITKETLPPSDAKFEFLAIHYMGKTAGGALQWLKLWSLADGESLTQAFLYMVKVAETGAADEEDDDLYTVKIICDAPFKATGSTQISLSSRETPFGETTCVFRNIRHGSIMVKKVIPGGIDPPDESFNFTLATHSEQLAAFSLGPGEGETVNKLVPDEYFVSETSLPDGWVLEDVTCDASEYHRTNDTTAPGVTINLQLGEHVTCEFQNEWLSGTQTPTPTASPSSTPTPTATPVEEDIDPEGPDYYPIEIEVNQAIQNLDNDVVLVADKGTVVRVYVNADEVGRPNIGGVLHGTRDGVTLPGSPLKAGYKIQVDDVDITYFDRLLRRVYSLDFELPLSWTHAGDVELTVEINPNHQPQERTYKNNMLSVRRPFHITPPVVMNWVVVKLKGSNTAASAGDYVEAFRYMRDVFPISRIKIHEGYSITVDGVNTEARKSELLDKLMEMDDNTSEADEEAVWVGLVHTDFPTPTKGEYYVLGLAYSPSQVAWTKPDDKTILSHEIGHTFGRMHVGCPAGTGPGFPENPDPAYPYPVTSISAGGPRDHWGYRLRADYKVKAPNHKDFMTYCNDKWVSDYTYEALWEYILGHFGKETLSSQVVTFSDSEAVQRVSGIITDSGTSAVIDRIYPVMDSSEMSESIGGDYMLELVDDNGLILYSRAFSPLVLADSEPSDNQPYSELIPRRPATAIIRVSKGGIILAEHSVSTNPPVVTVLSPNGGETVTGPTSVTWTASDVDGDSLSFTVQYSADNGATWQAVAVQLTETTFELDSDTLPGGQQALIRVIANDGYYSTSDESDQVFAVAKKGPKAMIIDPQDQQTLLPGVSTYLYGYGYDPEDGPLADDAYTWSSDKDGDLGIGADKIVSLSSGPHTITLTVTDSDGNQASDSVEMVNGMPLYLPTILVE